MSDVSNEPRQSAASPKLGLRRRLLFLFVAMVIFLAFVEGALRLFWMPPPLGSEGSLDGSGLYMRDAEIGWRMIPNKVVVQRPYANPEVTIRTNSRGFRDEEPAMERRAGVPRVVVLGDSYTFGWGVAQEATFVARLRELLPEVEFVNLGVSGYDLDQQHHVLRKEGLAIPPDLVVLPVCLNDFLQSNLDDDRSLTRTKAKRAKGWKASLRRNSHLYALLSHAVAASPALRGLFIQLGLKEEGGDLDDLDPTLLASLRTYTPAIQARADRLEASLGRIVRDCRAAEAAVLIAPIPSAESVRPSVLATKLSYTRHGEEEFDLSKPYRMIEGWAGQLAAPHVDARAPFRGKSGLYLRYDPHFSPAGHALFAEVLAPEVRTLLDQSK